MKVSTKRILCLAAVLVAATALPVLAGQAEHTWEAGPFFSYNVFDNDFQLKNDLGFGGRIGYNFPRGHELELTANRVAPDADNDVQRLFGFNPSVTIWTVTVGYVYNFEPKEDIVPFLTAGLGNTRLDIETLPKEDDATFYLGGGARFFVNDRFQVRLDGRYVRVDTDPTTDNWQFMGGVSWIFGGR